MIISCYERDELITRAAGSITSGNYKVLYGDAIRGAVEAEAKISPGRSRDGRICRAGLAPADFFPGPLALQRRGRASGTSDTYRYV
jgi:hypothetical protein